MITVTLAEVVAATRGRLVAAGPDRAVRGLCADSRRTRPGDLFFGLPGNRTDGARHAGEAVAAGAVAAVVRSAEGPGSPGVADDPARPLPRLEVDDPLRALGEVAGLVRARSAARTVGITGSSGKTTTKDLLLGALAGQRRVVGNEASFNTEVGVPLTLGRLEPDTEVLVVEVGARGPGHIRALCALARPEIGVVLNVGLAHVGLFGSRTAIAAAKAELVEALPRSGAAVLNADDPLVAAMADRSGARVLWYGSRSPAEVRATGVALDADARPRFRLELPDAAAPVQLPLPGAHLVPDALAAAAAAWLLGLSAEAIAGGLANARPSPLRMQLEHRDDGLLVVNDAYNANPASVAAALQALVALRRPGGRLVAVLGEMAELGAVAQAEHRRVGRLVAELGIDRLVGVGKPGALVAAAARAAGLGDHAAVVPDPRAVAAACAGLGAGDVVLLKASRAVGLEAAVPALLGEPALAGRQ